MPPPRMEPTPARENEDKRARDSQSAEGAATPKEKSAAPWKAWLPLGVMMVVLPLAAYGLTNYILVPKMQKSLVAAGVVPDKANAQAHGGVESSSNEVGLTGKQRQSVALNKMLVNVAGTMASRYLLTSLTLISDAPDFPKRIAQNEPQLRDMASGLMSMKTIADLEKPGARNLLRGALIAGFNTILGNASVQELYFTEFAIQ